MFDHTIYTPGNDIYKSVFSPTIYWIKSLGEGEHYILDTEYNNYTLSFNTSEALVQHADGLVVNNRFSGNNKHFIGVFDYTQGFLNKVNYVGNGKSNQAIPHSLKSNPEFVLFKNVSNPGDWVAWHYSFEYKGYLLFNSDDGFISDKLIFNNSVQNKKMLYAAGQLNHENEKYSAYIFGKSEYFCSGFYTGKADNFIKTANKPELLIVKRVDGTGSWRMFSNKMSAGDSLRVNSFGALTENDDVISVSITGDGFFIKNDCPAINQINAKYIYLAFTS